MNFERIVLIGPMAGYEDNNHEAFEEAESILRMHFPDCTVYNVHRVFHEFPARTARQHMAHAVEYLITYADSIAILPGWNESRGASAVVMLADALGIPMMLFKEG